MNKLLIDSQIFDIQKFGGISRYFTEIFVTLLEENRAEIATSICYSNNVYVSDTALINKDYFWKSAYLKVLDKMGVSIRKKIKKVNKNSTIDKLKKQQFDLFIPTYYDPYFLEYIEDKPFVLTVYDMIHELFPNYFSAVEKSLADKLILMEKATKIIAISESTKNDILKFYPHIDKEKIEVIYLSQSLDPKNYIEVELPEKFLLFVGNRDGYKNFTFFLKSVSSLLHADPNLHIVCAGGNKFNTEEKQLIDELKIANQISQSNFDDKELPSYYTKAKCFIFPSEYEGFGIPVLESMACGCPIILANHSSFPEVAGEAGVYFELNNESDLRSKVVSLLENETYRNQMIAKGYVQSEKFSWKKTAHECNELFKSTIKNE
jgi:glycosyltransferase involved in cell wall biosynthesis